MTFSVKIGSILLLLWLIFAWKSMSSIDCSETALSNTGDVWRFLILRVVRGVLDLAIPEATIQLVAFDVLSLLFFKLERISFWNFIWLRVHHSILHCWSKIWRLGIDNCSYCNRFLRQWFQPINVISDFSNFCCES